MIESEGSIDTFVGIRCSWESKDCVDSVWFVLLLVDAPAETIGAHRMLIISTIIIFFLNTIHLFMVCSFFIPCFHMAFLIYNDIGNSIYRY